MLLTELQPAWIRIFHFRLGNRGFEAWRRSWKRRASAVKTTLNTKRIMCCAAILYFINLEIITDNSVNNDICNNIDNNVNNNSIAPSSCRITHKITPGF